MFVTYHDPRLTEAVRTSLSTVEPVGLQDLSDYVVVEMEEINDLVVQDFVRLADGSVSIDVEESAHTTDEVIDMLAECVQSFTDYAKPIIDTKRGE